MSRQLSVDSDQWTSGSETESYASVFPELQTPGDSIKDKIAEGNRITDTELDKLVNENSSSTRDNDVSSGLVVTNRAYSGLNKR